MSLFVGLTKNRDGRPMLDLSLPGSCRHHLFGLRDVESIRKHLAGCKFDYVLYSSSTDFPEEYDAPKDYNARAVIQEALGIQSRPDDLVLVSKSDLERIAQLAKDKGFYDDLKALDVKSYDT